MTTAQVHAEAARQQRTAATANAIARLADRPHPDSLRLYDDASWADLAARAGFDVAAVTVERRGAVVAAYRAGYEQPRGDAAFDGLDF